MGPGGNGASETVFRDVEVDGRRVDVVVVDGRVTEIGTDLIGAEVVEGAGGALLPGLHDHHLHLLAMAAVHGSVDCSDGLGALRDAPPGDWIRGVRSGESVDRWALDALVAERPVRIQHRSGGLWMLNSVALSRVRLDSSPDVQRDSRGEPTGRLWRYDERLRASLPASTPSLHAVVEELHRYGITSVTDATPDLDPEGVALLRELPLDVTMLGDPDGVGPRKILLRDHDLPSWPELRNRVAEFHDVGRPVAVHCVSRESLLLTLSVLDDVGRMTGDRIEHAAIVPRAGQLSGLRVVTQPGFLADRGDEYLREVDADDVGHLYPYASLLAAGVDVIPSSDAPFGPLDPWAVMCAARDRSTRSGAVVNAAERVAATVALDGYLTDAGGSRRLVVPGFEGPLLLLHLPLQEAMRDPNAEQVRAVHIA